MEKEKEYGNELERLYKRLLKRRTKVAGLRRQQRDWLKFQKQQCDSYYDLNENEGCGYPRLSVSAMFAAHDLSMAAHAR